jgi:hypothetical protein
MTQIIESLCRDPHILLGAILGSLAILSFAAICIAAIVSFAWRKVRQTEDNNAIKHALLGHGMSAEEIATVVTAWPERRKSGLFRADCRQQRQTASRPFGVRSPVSQLDG